MRKDKEKEGLRTGYRGSPYSLTPPRAHGDTSRIVWCSPGIPPVLTVRQKLKNDHQRQKRESK